MNNLSSKNFTYKINLKQLTTSLSIHHQNIIIKVVVRRAVREMENVCLLQKVQARS